MKGRHEPSLGSLPDACLAQVLGHLPATDLLTASRANKRFQHLTADPGIWRCGPDRVDGERRAQRSSESTTCSVHRPDAFCDALPPPPRLPLMRRAAAGSVAHPCITRKPAATPISILRSAVQAKHAVPSVLAACCSARRLSSSVLCALTLGLCPRARPTQAHTM